MIMVVDNATEALDLSIHNRKSEVSPARPSSSRMSSGRSPAGARRSSGGRKSPATTMRMSSAAPSDDQLRQIKQEDARLEGNDRRCGTKRMFANDSDSDSDTLPLSTHTDSDQSTENDSGKCPSPMNVEESTQIRRTVRGVSVSLHDEKLWHAFAKCGTEMIINRGGRRMFPHINLKVDGLDACTLYSVILEIVSADDRRYKYLNNAWVTMGMSDPGLESQPFTHPDSPNTGAFWTDNKISFSKIRLTNNKDSKSIIDGIALLQSMHKYKAVIKIQNETDPCDFVRVFDFTESTFVAVTAYQNSQITQLKIQNNPFAKAFRDVNNPSYVQAGPASRRKESRQKVEMKKNNQSTKSSPVKKYGNQWHFPYVDHQQEQFDNRSMYKASSKRPHLDQKGYPQMAFMWTGMGRSMPLTMPMWSPESQVMFNAYAGHPIFPSSLNAMSLLHQHATSGMLDACKASSVLSSSTESSSYDRSSASDDRSDEGSS